MTNRANPGVKMMSEVLGRITDSPMLLFWCEGCKDTHQIDSSLWEFDGNYEHPTFSPSYLTWADANPKALPEYPKYRDGFRCHSFIKNGQIEYLSDCTHDLAGKTIDMTEWPDWKSNG